MKRHIFLGLMLCFAGSVFGMQRSAARYSRIYCWREFAVKDARARGIKNAESYVDQVAAKEAISLFSKVVDNLHFSAQYIVEIKSYGDHNNKELDALSKDLKKLQECARILDAYLERIKQKKD